MKVKALKSPLAWRLAAGTAAAAAVLAAGWVALPRLVLEKAVERARESGYEIEAERAVLRPWRVELVQVRLRGPKAEGTAKKVTVAYDGHLRTGRVSVEGADIALKSKEKRPGGTRARHEVTMTDSTVRLVRGTVSATAKVREARIDAAGRAWADADVKVVGERFTADAKKVRAENVDLEAPVELSADSVRISVHGKAEQAGGEAGGEAGSKRKLTVRARSVIVDGDEEAEADNVLTSVEVSPWGQEVHVEADRVALRGHSAETVKATVTRKTEEPGRVDVEASAGSMETENRRMSKGEFSVKEIRARGSLAGLGTGSLSVERAEVRVGSAQANVSARLTAGEAHLKVEMQEVGCQALLESLPRELVPVLRPERGTTRLSGTIAWRLEVTVDMPARKKPDVSIWLRNKCLVEEVPEELNTQRLSRPFRHDEYSADGRRTSGTAGPGTERWTPLGAISPLMPAAVMAMEDPSFMAHRGILIEAIENSMEQNITAGRFVRGGSTISMQLAKNLWLAREKTLSRKIQEAFLTTYLEQKMTKQQMIELYLNVVEFGPDLYGIGPAARHYFAKDPGSLTLSQSLFLASLLPSPKSAGYEEGKRVSQGRLDLLRKVMKMMLTRGTITEGQYEQGMRETPTFGDPSATGEVDPGPRVPGGIDPSEWR